jgi:hypothetical protein
MLTSYHAVVAAGRHIRLTEPVQLPPGMEVLVVVVSPSAGEVEAQEARLAALSEAEWRTPFAAYAELVEQNPPNVDPATLSDEELVELVHQVRADNLPGS